MSEAPNVDNPAAGKSNDNPFDKNCKKLIKAAK